MGMDQRVCLVGGGACTSIGASLLASAAAMRAGVADFGNHPFMVDTAGEPMVVSRAKYVPDDVIGVQRLVALAVRASEEALTPLLPFVRNVRRIPVIVGVPSPRPGLPENADSEFAEALRQQLLGSFPISQVEVMPRGHSAGLMALAEGVTRLQSEDADLCLIGGVDSYLTPATLEWLEESEQLHSAGPSNNPWGFVPGEAAGFCLLASSECARRWGLEFASTVRTVAVTHEPNLIKSGSVCLGYGLTAAFEAVLRPLVDGNRVDDIICDMNGEPYRAEEFGFATIRTNGYFIDASDFRAPADCWGDVGAASGPLFLNVSTVAYEKGYSRGPRTLVWTSSESGERAAAVLDCVGAAPRYQ
jgi:3-oxoacyl-[acyl-carrier-protein] synthase I